MQKLTCTKFLHSWWSFCTFISHGHYSWNVSCLDIWRHHIKGRLTLWGVIHAMLGLDVWRHHIKGRLTLWGVIHAMLGLDVWRHHIKDRLTLWGVIHAMLGSDVCVWRHHIKDRLTLWGVIHAMLGLDVCVWRHHIKGRLTLWGVIHAMLGFLHHLTRQLVNILMIVTRISEPTAVCISGLFSYVCIGHKITCITGCV